MALPRQRDTDAGFGACPRPEGALNCGHALVRQLVRDSVVFLAMEYQVDGFCFLEAESLTLGAFKL